jgi:hypothetical protein
MCLAARSEAHALRVDIPRTITIWLAAETTTPLWRAERVGVITTLRNDGRDTVFDQNSQRSAPLRFPSPHPMPGTRSRKNVRMQVVHLLTAAGTGIKYRPEAGLATGICDAELFRESRD